MKTSAIAITAVSTLLGLGAASLSAADPVAANPAMEKCYGVAQAGKNDCAGAKHACSGQSKANGGATEWIYLPKGTCERLVGGSLTAKK